jgi:bifunctional non-homologous end joining protein LigD
MALEEYKRKRDFARTPEPGPKVEAKSGHRFVIQKHRASHLHYDFRLEMEGVLKSWAVPKGPSLDPADKRLAMQVEDHPVSYFDFEGIIPPGNYGAGTVMVWDVGMWEPEGNASEMLKKGDLKFRLEGKKLHGSFVLAKMRSRRPGSKGNEWLLIKHKDEAVKPGFDIDKLDWSVLTKRSLDDIAGDEGSREWQSNRAAATPGAKSKDWLAKSIAIADKRRTNPSASRTSDANGKSPARKSAATKASARGTTAKPASKGAVKARSRSASAASAPLASKTKSASKKTSSKKKASALAEEVAQLKGTVETEMPRAIHPMLATLVDEPFSDPEWLYEIKWDGYRAVAFIHGGDVRLVSRNGLDMTRQYPELHSLPDYVRAQSAVVDGEIVAFDEQGRPSFSMMQQRTGIGTQGRRLGAGNTDIPVMYYAFDLIYLDGYDLRRVNLEERKRVLSEALAESSVVKFSEDFPDGLQLYEAAKQQNLEGVVAKRRRSCYIEKRSREWLKIKLTQMQECVIGGYTDPRGSREHFGSIILGLYDDKDRLVHVGQAGSGFTEKTHADMWKKLKALETDTNPFFGKVESTRKPHWVRPELVAQIKFTEWTHEGQKGGLKMRAPVYLGLRTDKSPKECRFELPKRTSDV